MTKRRVRIDIPIRQPDKLIELAEEIFKRNKTEHLFDNDLDMQSFHNNTQLTKKKRVMAKASLDESRQALYEANVHLGVAKGQTKSVKGTVYSMILEIRDFLKSLYKGDEEKIKQWGYDVEIFYIRGLRKVKIFIPVSSSELLIELADGIYNQHLKQPSLLKKFNMTEFNNKNKNARKKRQEAKQLNDLHEQYMRESEELLGLGYGQTKETQGTIYFVVNEILKRLQVLYKGSEENLNNWGFNATVVNSKYPIKGTGITTKKIAAVTKQSPLVTIHIIFKGSNGKKIYVAWGDGNADKINLIGHTTPQSIYHDYTEEGDYEIQINGDIGKLSYFKISSNQIISIDIPKNLKNLQVVNLKNNLIESTKVINDFFINLESSGVFNGELDTSGGKNAVPNAYGNVAKHNLASRGWEITTN